MVGGVFSIRTRGGVSLLTTEYGEVLVIAELGHFALLLACVVSLIGFVLPLIGAHKGFSGWMRCGQAASAVTAVLATVALGALTLGFITSDFSILNVARHSNMTLPAAYKVAAVWGSHEGSILFWVTVLSWWGLLVAVTARHLPERVLARILGTLSGIAFGLFLFITLTSNPFLRLFPPAADGADLNPLLQDPGMIFHPPLLYLGYVGFSVPFAFAVASLLSGRLDVHWARWMRPWTTMSWVLLTLGISLGSYWSYYELGWGGWWAWDPVENSSIMPWLTGTALMHSLLVTEKRGAFRLWTVFLAILTFVLSLLGTFLVRSGVLNSVHAFAADPERGLFILIFLFVVIGLSFALFLARAGRVAEYVPWQQLSREGGLWANNVLLILATGVILLGTLYPLALDVLFDTKISVGAPYFNTVFCAVFLPLALLMTPGIGLRWKSGKAAELAALCLPAGILSAVLAALMTAFGASPAVPEGQSPAVSAYAGLFFAWFVAFFVVTGPVIDIVRRVKTGGGRALTLASLGMAVAHIGVGLTIAGALVVSITEEERNVTMYPGQIMTVADVTYRFDRVEQVRGPNYNAAIGTLTVLDSSGKTLTVVRPEKRNYDSVTSMSMTEAAIVHRPWEDLYASMGVPTPDEKGWVMRLYVKPWVLLIWIGTLAMALGGLMGFAAGFARGHKKVQ